MIARADPAARELPAVRWWWSALATAIALAPLLDACQKPASRRLEDRRAVADTCRAAAKDRGACKRCCPASSGWQFSPEKGCTCLVPRRCPGGDRDLRSCAACCERQETKGMVLVGPVFEDKGGCSCQYL